MKHYDAVVIGFGKGGKTLAGALAGKGKSVALIERSEQMFGGTCINVACIPTKSLDNSARLSAMQGGSFVEKAVRYRAAVEEKRRLTGMLRQKNFDKAVSAGVEVVVGSARFTDAHRMEVEKKDGEKVELTAEQIFINTGSRPFLPPIDGLKTSRYVYTSETLMELEELPEHLVIIGGGYIGLEFASYYINFGSEVTVIQDGNLFIPREDREVAEAVRKDLSDRGVRIICSAEVRGIEEEASGAVVRVFAEGKELALPADAVLAATGRRPELTGLHTEAAGIELTGRGAIKVDEHLRTNVPGIWAMGDVTGGLQFTYISLDDSRIVRSELFGDGARTTENRGEVPYSVFLDPPLSRVGMSEEEAREKGYDVRIARLPVAAIPRAQLMRRPAGLLKAIVDAKTGKILGAHLFCSDSHEMINQVKMAMDADLPYTVLRDSVYNHPTMSEAFNDLFAVLKD